MATPQRQYPNEPQRDPQQGPELRNLREGGVERKVGGGWRFGFWWIWILIIAGIWYVGFGWGNSGGWIWGHGRHAATNQNDTALSGPGVPILNASSKQSYIGQAFEIRNVPVERRASNQALWIGSRFNSTPMLVVLPGGNDVTAAPAGSNGPANPGNNAPGETTVTPNGTRNNSAPSGGNTQAGNAAQASGSNGSANPGNTQATANAGTGTPRQWLDVTGKVVKAPPAAQAKQQWGLSDADANQLEQEGAYIQATQVQTAHF